MNLDFAHIWTQTPAFGKFLWVVLLFMSVWSLSVSIGKWWNLRKAQKETVKFAPEFSQFLEEDNLAEAIKLAESYKKSHVARVLGGALAEVKPLIMDGSVTVSDINTAERAVEREMLMEMVSLKRGLSILATVGATAPFVGLLGTVVGVITAFQGIAATGSGGIGAVSAGISEALVETALGLVVAIPAVWFYNYLTGRLEYFNVEMDNSSSELVDYFIKKTA
jgi:biopolymer transport protein ExbB